MKIFSRITILLVMLACLLYLPSTAFAMPSGVPALDGKVIFGGTYTLESGGILNESLVVIGGVVVVEEGSIVVGDVIVVAGNVTIDGEVSKNVVVLGGVLSLGETAVVYGDLIAPGSAFNRAEGAKIQGQIITEDIRTGSYESPVIPEIPEIPEVPNLPEVPEVTTPLTFQDRFFYVLTPIINIFWFFFQTFALAAMAVLLIMFFPKQVERTNKVIKEYPIMAGGMGCLTLVATVFLMGITILTILAPLAIGVILILALFLGWISVGLDVGRRVGEALNQEWKLPVQAAVGAALLFILVSGFGYIHLGFFSAVLSLVISSVGLGSVLVTRFGTREYTQTAGASAPNVALEAFGLENKKDTITETGASSKGAEEDSGLKTKSKPKSKSKD